MHGVQCFLYRFFFPEAQEVFLAQVSVTSGPVLLDMA